MEVRDFKSLKDLIITDQLKKRVPGEIREHFVDEWARFYEPSVLADKLDGYESVRSSVKKTSQPEMSLSNTSYSRSNIKKEHAIIKNDIQSQRYKLPFKQEPKQPTFKPTCYSCGRVGHTSRVCHAKNHKKTSPTRQINAVETNERFQEQSSAILTAKVAIPVYSPAKENEKIDELQFVHIKCGNEILKAVIDTGAQISVVRADVVEGQSVDSGGTIQIMSAFGEREVTELKIFNLKIDDSRHGVVPIMCAVSKRLVNDMLVCSSAYEALLENVQFIHNPANSYVSSRAVEGITADDPKSISSQEMTRETYPSEIYIQAVSKANEEEQLPEGRETRSTFIKMQREDDTLKKLWSLAEKQKNSVKIHNGILVHSEYTCGENIDQVVLPQCKKREEVLKMAHDVPLGGHLGEQKTRQRIKYSFYWPTIKQDVKRFCESCKICQLRKPITYRDRVPIQPLVRPEIPFEVWSVDCIGPLEPPSRRNHHFIICAVDLCTRWAEAIPVKEISAKTTCNVLLKIFTQTGFPKMICSDQGTNFTSKLSEMFLSVMGVSPRFSTPGHPESMGAVERWNRTLKDMLIYGRLPSGPISLLKEVWVGERNIPTTLSRSVEKYLEDLIEKLRKAHEIAAETAEATQNNYASYYNLRSREKQFKVGDKVLVLLPSSTHKLMKTWIGPATIIEITRPYSAKVELDDGGIRELHFNKLRPYIARVGQVGLIFDQDSDFGDLHYAPTDMAVSSMGMLQIT
ncbi:hypothetical protein TNCV_3600711 [Trichonephila clavipes]|nr:hypothetical protein TNCV_3600711 [Trichonephila clavipes]